MSKTNKLLVCLEKTYEIRAPWRISGVHEHDDGLVLDLYLEQHSFMKMVKQFFRKRETYQWLHEVRGDDKFYIRVSGCEDEIFDKTASFLGTKRSRFTTQFRQKQKDEIRSAAIVPPSSITDIEIAELDLSKNLHQFTNQALPDSRHPIWDSVLNGKFVVDDAELAVLVDQLKCSLEQNEINRFSARASIRSFLKSAINQNEIKHAELINLIISRSKKISIPPYTSPVWTQILTEKYQVRIPGMIHIGMHTTKLITAFKKSRDDLMRERCKRELIQCFDLYSNSLVAEIEKLNSMHKTLVSEGRRVV